jgi:hypothetical protein
MTEETKFRNYAKDACIILERHGLLDRLPPEMFKWWKSMYKDIYTTEQDRKKYKYRQMTLEECIENEKLNKK